MADKLPLIIWSGGLDSTYLIWEHIAKGESVDVAYIELENNKNKTIREKRAREKLKKTFNEDTRAFIRKDYYQKISTLKLNNKFGSIQPLTWVFGMNIVFNPDKHSHIELGYIKEDEFWHFRHYFEEVHKNIRKLSFNHNAKIKYPLEWICKSNIYKNYNANDFGKKLLKDVTWCQSSTKQIPKSCECCSCKKMKIIENSS